ncbi:MAG: AtpZ/AtpI family protein [Elusimicrobia bacterium]|nr:AtpZ/AtpI family protein [Elusimicrobiota bacterium]
MKGPKPVKSPLAHVYAGTQLAASVLTGFLVGWWLDRRFKSTPWLLLAGSAAGLFVGLYQFLAPFLKDD